MPPWTQYLRTPPPAHPSLSIYLMLVAPVSIRGVELDPLVFVSSLGRDRREERREERKEERKEERREEREGERREEREGERREEREGTFYNAPLIKDN